MRHPCPILLTILLLHLPSTLAISLSEFHPVATNLTDPCTTIYNSEIPGCTASDFTSSGPCSSTCIAGMVSLNAQVYAACASDPQNNQRLIAAFLAGQGINTLCPNVVVTTVGGLGGAVTPTTTQGLGAGTNAAISATSAAVGGGILMDTSSPPGVASTTTIPVYSTLAGTGGGLLMDTASAPAIASTTSAPPSQTMSSQITTIDVTSTTSITTTAPPSSTPSPSSSPISSIPTTNTPPTALSTITMSPTNPTSSATATTTTSTATATNNCSNRGGSPFDYCSAAPPSSSTPRFFSSMLFASLVLGGVFWLAG